jgi:hypothetical protein
MNSVVDFVASRVIRSPLTKINDTECVEGYWRQYKIPNPLLDFYWSYPYPWQSISKPDSDFTTNLSVIMSYASSDCTHDFQIDGSASVAKIGYKGWSNCRICGRMNGSEEYVFRINGVKFRFPSGLMHYYTDHNVKPSPEFKAAIMSLKFESK